MVRPLHIPSAEFPYHITARACNREVYPLPLDIVWEIMCEYIWLTHMKYNLLLHSFVLMPNHFHMEAQTPDANLSESMNYFMSRVARELNSSSERINQLHGARYFRCLLTTPHYCMHAYKYIYRNPVKAKLVDKVEEYKYSTLQMYLGLQSIKVPLCRDENLMSDIDGTLNWLNKEPKPTHWLEVRNALRHGEFKLPRDSVTQHASELDRHLL